MKTTKRNTMALAAALLALTAQLAVAQDWTPANGGVPTALWLDADDATTITKDGGNLVSQWNDKSGNARHVTQATAANQPTYQAAGLNSKPSLYFDAASRYLTSAAVSAHSGPWSVFAVAKQAGTGPGIILAQDGDSGTRIAHYARFNSSSDILPIPFNSAGTPFFPTMTGAVTSPCIVGSVCSSSSATAYLNGAGGTATGITGTLATGSRPITVGRIDISGAESYLNGQVSEIILVPSAVSEAVRQKFEGYLAWKWGTVASLPSGHPYKSAAPTNSLSVTLTSPTNGQVIVAGSSVSATAMAAGGTPPYTVNFYLDGSGTPASTTPNATSPLTVNLGVLSAGSHTVHAKVTDSTSTTVSSGTAVPFSIIVDTTPPTPDPMTFAGSPASPTATSLTMAATTATDALSPPVQYWFEDANNSANKSGWISSPTWTSTGLTTGVTYSFRVKARDSATPPNQTAFSSILTGVPVNVTGLRCEDLVAPLGVDLPQPALSWQYEDTSFTRGQKQSAYRILVASSAANLAANQGDLWDSGQVASEQSLRIPYAGTALASRQRCHWKVRVWDKDGSPSAWSAPSEWTMGLLNPVDWTAKWIGNPASGAHPWMRRNFVVNAGVNGAKVYVNTPCFYELFINGRKVGDDVLMPAQSEYQKRAFYNVHDVSHLLQAGTNCIALWMGPSWFQTSSGYAGPIVRAQLEIETSAGTSVISTDGQWRTAASCITQLGTWSWGNFGGERYDAGNDVADWNLAAFNDSAWANVAEITAPNITTSWQALPGNRMDPPIAAKSITAFKGKWLIDFGTTLTGWMRLQMNGLTPGQQVVLDYSDMLDPPLMFSQNEDGIQTHNQRDIYVAGASPEGVFQSKFNQHAFRYVLVGGLTNAPELGDAQAMMVRTHLDPAGEFRCSNELFNRIHEITVQTTLTQSPMGVIGGGEPREKCGYGDGGSFLTGGVYHLRSDSLFRKWHQDWRDTQREDGWFKNVAPNFGEDGGGGPSWGGQASELVRRLSVYYGDKTAARDAYPALKKYVDYLESHTENDILRYFDPSNRSNPTAFNTWQFLGDWTPPHASESQHDFQFESIDQREFFNNCYRVLLWQDLAYFAGLIGDTAERIRCENRLAVLRPLIHNFYFDATTNNYRANRQAYLVIALRARIMPEALRPVIFKHLEDNIVVEKNGHLDCGLQGSFMLLDLLAQENRSDLAALIIGQETYPGWGFLVKKRKVTTWPETWSGWGSQVIQVVGTPGAWFYEGLGGIRPDPTNPGFKHIILKPAVVGGVTWVECHHDSPYGRIVSNWLRADQQLTMNITIPPNSTAEIHVPAGAVEDVTESGQAASGAPGVQFLRMENRHAVFAVGAGSYVFTGTLPVTLGPVVDVPAGSPLALDFPGSQTITTLLLGGVIQPPGTYNAVTHPAWFTGTGSLLVMPTSRTWDNGASSGLWNDTDANWTGQTWTPGAAATLAHSATASTITLSSGLTAASVTIGDGTNNANYTFTGGSLTATGFTLQANTGNNLGTAGYPTTTLNNTTVNVTSLAAGRGHLVIDGSSTVTAGTIGGPGGDADGAWGQLTIAGTANVTATNGFSAGTTAWGLNLNGGTLTTKGLDYGPHTYFGTANLNFNGTLVKANRNNADFITVNGGLAADGPLSPEIQAGGAKIDTNGFDIGIQVGLQGSGALTKSGAGKLTLNQIHTYQGGTTVEGGTLAVTGTLGSGDLTVAEGAVAELLSPSGTVADTAAVRLTGSGRIHLAAGVTETVSQLYIDGVLRMPGTWNAARDPLHFSGTGNLIVTNGGQPTPAETWRKQHFDSYNNNGDAADDADPDADGSKNVLERALGTNPRAGDASGQPIAHSGSLGFHFTYNRSRAAIDLNPVIEVSATLQSPAWRDAVLSPSPNADGSVALIDDSPADHQVYRFTAQGTASHMGTSKNYLFEA